MLKDKQNNTFDKIQVELFLHYFKSNQLKVPYTLFLCIFLDNSFGAIISFLQISHQSHISKKHLYIQIGN